MPRPTVGYPIAFRRATCPSSSNQVPANSSRLSSPTFGTSPISNIKYTLISVKQIWREQSIDARFRDLNHLELPPSAGGITIPYDEKSDLPVVRFISSAQFYNNAGIIGKKTSALTSILHDALIGFHSTKSVHTSLNSRLPRPVS